ncbi:hypothetical protein [Altericista sp. CCNU0014]
MLNLLMITVIFDSIATGASNNLHRATDLAERMQVIILGANLHKL